MVSGLQLDGGLTEREALNLERFLQRGGFQISRDSETGVLSASRPDVIEKPGFINAIVGIGEDTRHYGGHAWGRLKYCVSITRQARRSGGFEAFQTMPAEFLPVGFGDTRRLIAETMRPTVEWAEAHTEVWGINNRLINAWRAVAEAYEASGMDMHPDPEPRRPIDLSNW